MEEQKTENGECFGEMPQGAPQGMLQEMVWGMPTGF